MVRLQTKVVQINWVVVGALCSIIISILIGRNSDTWLDLPQPSVQVHPQCAGVTMTSGWLALTVVCTQAYRSRDQGQRTTHAGVS